jgi:hypothetical protein
MWASGPRLCPHLCLTRVRSSILFPDVAVLVPIANSTDAHCGGLRIRPTKVENGIIVSSAEDDRLTPKWQSIAPIQGEWIHPSPSSILSFTLCPKHRAFPPERTRAKTFSLGFCETWVSTTAQRTNNTPFHLWKVLLNQPITTV